jgi:hypothetical protein
MNPIKTIIRAVVITGAIVMFGGVVGWSWTDFATQPARAEIANGGNQVGSNQVPSPTQPPTSHPAQVSMEARDWNFKFSVNTTGGNPSPPPRDLRKNQSPFRLDRGGWSMDFFVFGVRGVGLQSPTRTYWEITTASPLLVQGWYVKVSGRAPPSPARDNLDCRMYFQEVGDDLSGQGQYAYYRWRSTKPLIPSAAEWSRNFVQVVGLEPQFWSAPGEPKNWSNFVTGEQGDASVAATAGFQQALANPQSIGIICSAYSRGDAFVGDSFLRDSPPFADQLFSMFSFAVCDPFADTNEACAPPSAQQR